MGVNKGDPTHRQDKRSIGIELVNVGPLRLNRAGNGLCFWAQNWTAPYCKLDQPNLYVKADFRGEKYFAAFDPAQIESAARLTQSLLKQFAIPTAVFQKGDILRHQGIATHTDFRTDKYDVGPAFPWATFQSLLKPLLP